VPQPELLIFDCDGVLVDSEPSANRVFAEALAELGLTLTIPQMYAEFVGRPMSYCLQRVTQLLGRPVPPEFEGDLRRRTLAVFRKELRATRGIEEVLDRIRIPMCVASSGDHDKMRATLGMTGLLPRFEGRLFSATQVAHGKPAPDVYLFAASQCGVEPSACAVIEDSPVGVQAGVAAGMRVLGYAGHGCAEPLSSAGAYVTFDDMRDLPRLIDKM
jgi:HAD superfamily hydrolase (TIGR01509 family)